MLKNGQIAILRENLDGEVKPIHGDRSFVDKISAIPIGIFEHFQLSERYEIYETLIEIRSS